MKIVIDIPEEEYKMLVNSYQFLFNEHTFDNLRESIKNGTPLPKGHGRLIEVTDQLEYELFTFTRYTGIDEAPFEDATKIIDNAPTIIDADKEENNDI